MKIKYPYLPKGKTILYLPATNKFLKEARKQKDDRGCFGHPTGAVVVKDKKIIGRGSNAGKKVNSCPRHEQGFKTGTGYHLCQKHCLQEGHAEIMAIRDALKNGDPRGADLYLEGHWWVCQPCWETIIKSGIKNVYLQDNSKKLYQR